MTDITVASGRAYVTCTPNTLCTKIHIDTDWETPPELQPITLLRTANADAADTRDPFLSFRVTRNAWVRVFFNEGEFNPGGVIFCTSPIYPTWASDGTIWEHAGRGTSAEHPSFPDVIKRFSSRETAVNAGERISLGPNTVRNCPPGYQPLMYIVHVFDRTTPFAPSGSSEHP